MKTYTIDDIRRLDPCYDPTRYLPDGWSGTLLDILAVEDCPAEDRLWAVIGLLDDSRRRLLACRLVRFAPLADGRTVWDLLTDERSRNAVEVTERFAVGDATEGELEVAIAAAWDVDWDADWAAVRATVRATVRDAAWGAAWDVARAVARAAARAADWATVRDADRAADRAADWATVRDAAWGAAWAAAWDAQIKIAREFLATNPA